MWPIKQFRVVNYWKLHNHVCVYSVLQLINNASFIFSIHNDVAMLGTFIFLATKGILTTPIIIIEHYNKIINIQNNTDVLPSPFVVLTAINTVMFFPAIASERKIQFYIFWKCSIKFIERAFNIDERKSFVWIIRKCWQRGNLVDLRTSGQSHAQQASCSAETEDWYLAYLSVLQSSCKIHIKPMPLSYSDPSLKIYLFIYLLFYLKSATDW